MIEHMTYTRSFSKTAVQEHFFSLFRTPLRVDTIGGGGGLRPQKGSCTYNRPPFSGSFHKFHSSPEQSLSDLVGGWSAKIPGRPGYPPPRVSKQSAAPYPFRCLFPCHCPSPSRCAALQVWQGTPLQQWLQTSGLAHRVVGPEELTDATLQSLCDTTGARKASLVCHGVAAFQCMRLGSSFVDGIVSVSAPLDGSPLADLATAPGALQVDLCRSCSPSGRPCPNDSCAGAADAWEAAGPCACDA